ncbi:MAG: polysaccharide biosynthesis/export family protein, partial [Nitrospiraceae bacterium]
MWQLIPRYFIGFLGVGVILAMGLLGCHNPVSSSLPPSAISPPGATVPPLSKGDVYADETVPTPETPIETGDTLEVVIRRGAGEEKFASVVRENGMISIGFMEVNVGGATAAVAETRLQEAAVPYMREPRVQVLLKKQVLKVKRVFVFGDVKKPGMVPMPRHMTVMQAIAAVD